MFNSTEDAHTKSMSTFAIDEHLGTECYITSAVSAFQRGDNKASLLM
jgi:hypothetical protein